MKKCNFFFLYSSFVRLFPLVFLDFCLFLSVFVLPFCAFDIILVFNVLHRLFLLRIIHRSFVSSFVSLLIVRRFVMRVATIYLDHCNVSSAGRMERRDRKSVV